MCVCVCLCVFACVPVWVRIVYDPLGTSISTNLVL